MKIIVVLLLCLLVACSTKIQNPCPEKMHLTPYLGPDGKITKTMNDVRSMLGYQAGQLGIAPTNAIQNMSDEQLSNRFMIYQEPDGVYRCTATAY